MIRSIERQLSKIARNGWKTRVFGNERPVREVMSRGGSTSAAGGHSGGAETVYSAALANLCKRPLLDATVGHGSGGVARLSAAPVL